MKNPNKLDEINKEPSHEQTTKQEFIICGFLEKIKLILIIFFSYSLGWTPFVYYIYHKKGLEYTIFLICFLYLVLFLFFMGLFLDDIYKKSSRTKIYKEFLVNALQLWLPVLVVDLIILIRGMIDFDPFPWIDYFITIAVLASIWLGIWFFPVALVASPYEVASLMNEEERQEWSQKNNN